MESESIVNIDTIEQEIEVDKLDSDDLDEDEVIHIMKYLQIR